MRHEKIIAPEMAFAGAEDVMKEEEAKAPPVALQHFWYSGRAAGRSPNAMAAFTHPART